MCNRVSIENSAIIKDRMMDTFCIVMDLNQPHEKVVSKLKAVLLTSNWKTSEVLSCVKVHCSTGRKVLQL